MDYLKVWVSFRELLEPLTDAERGRLFVAMLEYAASGTEPQLSGNERYVWPAARQSINNARERSEQMRANASKPTQNGANGSKREQTGANASKPTQNGANGSAPFDKEKEKDNILTTTTTGTRAREETSIGDVDLDPLILKIQRELNGLTDTHYQALNDYREELGDELVGYAIDQAVANGVRNWAYVEAILRGWVTLHIHTIGEAKAEHEKHKGDKPVQKPKLLRSQMYEQREYRESELAEALGVDDVYGGAG